MSAAPDPVAEFVTEVGKRIDKMLPTKRLFDPGSLVIGASLVVIAAVLIRMMLSKPPVSATVTPLREVAQNLRDKFPAVAKAADSTATTKGAH